MEHLKDKTVLFLSLHQSFLLPVPMFSRVEEDSPVVYSSASQNSSVFLSNVLLFFLVWLWLRVIKLFLLWLLVFPCQFMHSGVFHWTRNYILVCDWLSKLSDKKQLCKYFLNHLTSPKIGVETRCRLQLTNHLKINILLYFMLFFVINDSLSFSAQIISSHKPFLTQMFMSETSSQNAEINTSIIHPTAAHWLYNIW